MKHNKTILVLSFLFISVILGACKETSTSNTSDEDMKRPDPHSYAIPGVAVVKHLELDIAIDFDNRKISGSATYDIDHVADAKEIRMDANGLKIQSVTLDGSDTPVDYRLGEHMEHMGSELLIPITPETKKVTINYETSPDAEALQWLSPAQTADKTHPFLFTQSQAILARTWIPCQDGPGIRFTYHAKVKVPKGLMAVMSAENPQEVNPEGNYEFTMSQPVPAYLMALAVGNMEFREMGERTGVYAEPSMLEKSVYEFAETERMLIAAEKMYGPYRWDRYDLLILPPSFPFGGMENPRLTFVTPTVIAGDRSLTSLIAHELAHSWSGNLVTNATWNDFWLNEGFTVYFERRIMENLYGGAYAEMLAQIGFQDLEGTLMELGQNSPDTRLKLALENRNPDDGMTDIAYEKGYFLLRMIEEREGRERFDAFLKQYFEAHAFQSMTTEDFLAYLDKELLSKSTDSGPSREEVESWVYQPGIPVERELAHSARFNKVDEVLRFWKGGASPQRLETEGWTSHEWLHFIRHLPEEMTADQMKKLDITFAFTNSGNSEIQAAWFMHCIRNEYTDADAALEDFLMRVGRRKFLKPLYSELAKTPSGKEKGRDIYAKARQNYHAVSIQTIDEILGWDEETVQQ